MGIDYHAAKWLKSYKNWNCKKILSIGRQNWWLSKKESKSIGITNPPTWGRHNYSDFFWEQLGVECDTIDIVNNESPTYLGDLSKIDTVNNLKLTGRYDCVIDFGTAEHVANQHSYWKNLWDALKTNGELYCILPADGMCGHGLYQFSPEFFSVIKGFDCQHLYYVTYGIFVRFKSANVNGRFQNKFWWPTYVAAKLIKNNDSFELPIQFSGATIPSSKEKLWAKWAVEIPGIRVVERVVNMLK